MGLDGDAERIRFDLILIVDVHLKIPLTRAKIRDIDVVEGKTEISRAARCKGVIPEVLIGVDENPTNLDIIGTCHPINHYIKIYSLIV